MEIEFTLMELKNMESALEKLSRAEMNVPLAFKLSKFLKKVKEELSVLEDVRQKLVIKYGVTMPDGSVSVAENQINTFMKEYEELVNQKVSIPKYVIKCSDIQNLTMTPEELMSLEKILQE